MKNVHQKQWFSLPKSLNNGLIYLVLILIKRIHFELSILFIEEVLLLAKTLYLMRHGQTLFNFKGLIQDLEIRR